MITFILTGGNRGLGYEIHNAILLSPFPGPHIFITRKPLRAASREHQYLYADFNEDDLLNIDINISPNSKVLVFISNAATIEPINRAVDIGSADIEAAMRVNCLAPLALSQRLALEAQKIGARLFILNLSSGATKRPVKGWLTYCVSKAAASVALDVLAAENDHVKVQHLDPGVMDTDMQRYIRQQPKEIMPEVNQFRAFQEGGTLKNPREVAANIIKIVQEELQ